MRHTEDRGAGRSRIRRLAGPLLLALALVVSARVTVSAGRSPEYGWAASVCLIPLFLTIRICRPWVALLCGGAWGASVFVCGLGVPASGIAPSFIGALLLTAVPALYASGGAWLTRSIGFSPFVLGVGWMFVELAVGASGPTDGLATSAQRGAAFEGVANVLGYVVAAFLVAAIAASLVATATSAYAWLRRGGRRIRNEHQRLWRQALRVAVAIQSAILDAQARAPPMTG